MQQRCLALRRAGKRISFVPTMGYLHAGHLALLREGRKQGDVLIFHSLAVHKGVSNRSDKLRMSMDARYQRASDPIAPGSLLPHSQPNDWESVFADAGTASDKNTRTVSTDRNIGVS